MNRNNVFLSLFFTIFLSFPAYAQIATGDAISQTIMPVYQLVSYLLHEKFLYHSGAVLRPVTCMEGNNAQSFSFKDVAGSSSKQRTCESADSSGNRQGAQSSRGVCSDKVPPPPIPPSQPPEKVGMALYQDLVRKFDDMIVKMGDILSRKNIKLILALDLDFTLYEGPERLGFTNIETIDEMDTRVLLQQQWSLSFASFLREFNSRVLLIYNTSRSVLGEGLTTNGYGWIDIGESVVMQDHLTYPLPYDQAHRVPPMITFRFFPNDNISFNDMSIPKPDVIIADTGRVIQWNSRHDRLIPSEQRDRIASSLSRWHEETMDDIEKSYQSDFSPKNNLELQPRKSTTHRRLKTGFWGVNRLLGSTLLERFYSFERPSVIHIKVIRGDDGREYIHGNNYYFSSLVNKGSTLSLVVDLLLPSLLQDGTPETNIWEIIAGDDYADLPALFPDREVAVFSDRVRDDMLQRRKDEFKVLGQTYDYTTAPIWKLSLVSSKQYFIDVRCSSYLTGQLWHPKIVDVQMRGLFGIVEQILKKLEE